MGWRTHNKIFYQTVIHLTYLLLLLLRLFLENKQLTWFQSFSSYLKHEKPVSTQIRWTLTIRRSHASSKLSRSQFEKSWLIVENFEASKFSFPTTTLPVFTGKSSEGRLSNIGLQGANSRGNLIRD